ncbi:hypothetical protein [Nocardia lijiangensis]|uniref:hypothetical protein n=1 Tax=Nocardia lijiangensis TaxID=299618 RepID=UPI000AA7A770|nr:hypothetical protein [Nocardia lijiangensis]
MKGQITRAAVRRVALLSSGFAVLLASCSGGGLSGERVDVAEDSPALEAAFQRVLDAREPKRLGDIVAESGLPLGAWDRMYSFYTPISADDINAVLGTPGLKWSGLQVHSESLTQVFLRDGEVVYAFKDDYPRYGVDGFATPDSAVRPTEKEGKNAVGSDVRFWTLEIDKTPVN